MAVRRSLISLFTNNFSSTVRNNVSVSLYFSTSVEKEQPLTVYELLTNKHHFSQEAASRVASSLTHLKTPKNSDSILSFLKENGFSITQLEKITRYRPRYLTADLEKSIKPKVTLFQDMGFSDEEIAEIISKNPGILQTSIKDGIIPTLSVLKRILGSRVEMAKVLRHSSWLFEVDLETTLVPNIDLLKSCGIPMEVILKHMYNNPRFFSTKLETMRRYVSKVDGLGVDRSSKMFFYAVQVVASMSDENLELKFNAFRDLGFSEDDIFRVFRSTPIVFLVSEEKIRKIKDVLLETEKYDTSCIVKCPTSLTQSVETRYKPRLQVLRILEMKNLIEKWPKFSTLAKMPNKKFCEKYVDPFSDELPDIKLLIVS